MILLLTLLALFLLIGFLFFLRRERAGRQGLERKLTELNQKLKSSFERLEEERARLETTFSGMVEGVLLTDREGDILHLNPTFREMFGLQGKVEGRSALEVLASVACDDAIQEVIRKGKVVEREIAFEKPKRRVFQVHFSPMVRDGKISGVVSVFHDLTTIRRLEEVRRDFVANLSHELKTPLTAIRGYSETLLEGIDALSPEARKHVEIIFRHSAELSHLTENLLNLSRIESGKEEVMLEPIALKPFVDRVIERFQAQAQTKRIQLHNEISESAPSLQADPHKLNQILGNLVDNAVKYTPEGGEVWIRYTPSPHPSPPEGERDGLDERRSAACSSRPERMAREKGEGVIEIEDTGPGIPESDRERIFERFYRVDKARSRDTGGAGLGLAIVKHLVELHGGRIQAESGTKGGSRFQVFLPQS